MIRYRYLVGDDDKIEKIIVTKEEYIIEIPVGKAPFSKKQEIEEHLNALFNMKVKFELANIKLREGSRADIEQEETEKIKKFISSLTPDAKKLLLNLDKNWKDKSEIEEILGFRGNPQKLAGVLSGITKQAKKAGFISENSQETLVEQIRDGNTRKYRLTELGLKVKQILKQTG